MRYLLIRRTVLITWVITGSYVFPVIASEHKLGDPEKGRSIYLEHCSECHGDEGKGDGPRASVLAPGPGNLVSAATSAKSDKELLSILTNGVPRTAMQGWKDRLSEQDRQHVLAFIRSFVRFQAPSLTPPPPKDAEN